MAALVALIGNVPTTWPPIETSTEVFVGEFLLVMSKPEAVNSTFSPALTFVGCPWIDSDCLAYDGFTGLCALSHSTNRPWSMRPESEIGPPSLRAVKLSPPAMRKELDATVYFAAGSMGLPPTMTLVMREPAGLVSSNVYVTLLDRPILRNGREAPSGCHCCSRSLTNVAPEISRVATVLLNGMTAAACANVRLPAASGTRSARTPPGFMMPISTLPGRPGALREST